LRYDEVLWKMPLVMVGWLIAQSLRRQGVKGVNRKIDFKRLKSAFENAINTTEPEKA
jgi:hypothetical protein